MKKKTLVSLNLLFLALLFFLGCNTVSQPVVGEAVSTPTAPLAGPTATAGQITPELSTPQEEAEAAPPATNLPAGVPSTRTIYPQPLTGYLANPYMGWQDTQHNKPRFVETVGYKRINWDVLNPAEDTYDWSIIESFRADMARHKGTISFRIRTAQPPPWGKGQVMPAWLVAHGVPTSETESEVKGVKSTEPLYANCLFLEAHAKFIEALRQRYDGDPDIAFIDIGSYGAYGEWHSEQYDEEPDSLDWHTRRRIIDMYIGGKGTRPCLDKDNQIKQVTYDYPGFQQTQLLMPYTPWFADSLAYALTRRADIGIRHDALGSKRHQQKYEEEIGRWVEQRWPHAPIVFEFFPDSYRPADLRRARSFAQQMHASLVHDNFEGQGRDKLIQDLLAVIGYRLVLREITYSSEVRPGDALSVKMTWENTGVAPPYYRTYPLVLSLTDAQDQTKLNEQLEPDIREWLPGKTIPLQGGISIPADFPPGQYHLRLAFVDPATQQPVLTLAIAGQDEQGRYLIGPVDILAQTEVSP